MIHYINTKPTKNIKLRKQSLKEKIETNIRRKRDTRLLTNIK